jgi:hypothetical protein
VKGTKRLSGKTDLGGKVEEDTFSKTIPTVKTGTIHMHTVD